MSDLSSEDIGGNSTQPITSSNVPFVGEVV